MRQSFATGEFIFNTISELKANIAQLDIEIEELNNSNCESVPLKRATMILEYERTKYLNTLNELLNQTYSVYNLNVGGSIK